MHEDIVEHVAYERGKNLNRPVMDDYDAGWADGYRSKNVVDLSNITKSMDHTLAQLEELLFLIGDRPEPATEDELMNYVIGMIESVKIKKLQLSQNEDTIHKWKGSTNTE